ncbi:Lysophospholipase, alpha-beta hydrolase superfamily [Saccharopolyspora kobensis]|uniref:Monoacylglycerol lipase n=1 Tax=Saccharopolyspora kobensis TaxID=146035 RepID=A0A1H6A0F7_9PSEU|nr:alpha/beta hydrolase [Saccharopolyspora kobensis]SEG41525.1 Lysophospholipase, alpha-beta hydrolase superfamily [Saccharopolyspora kobensis]SFE16456.1 Lysophospholipase, alpha-beta hydrolase superfamily [Saccharopolyspora kobensis]
MTEAHDDRSLPAAAHSEGTSPSGQYWQSWTVEQPGGVVVLVHGLHEHSGRYRHVAARLNAAGYAVYALDHPGHGRSPGTRGNIGGMAAAVTGVGLLARLAADRHSGVPVFVYGHSMGGLISLQYLTGTPLQRIRGAVISAPALDAGPVSAVERIVAPLLSKLLPDLGVRTIDADTISRDPAVVRDFRTDPLNHNGKMRARTAVEIMRTAEAMPQRLPSLTMPLLVLHGGADRLMPPAASELVRDRAGSADLTFRIHEGLHHESHNEPEQEQVLDEIVAWLDALRAG